MTKIHVECACGKSFEVPEDKAGKRFKCPGCGTVLQVPEAPAAELVELEAVEEPDVTTPSPAVSSPAAPRVRDGRPAPGDRPARAGARARRETAPAAKSKTPLIAGAVAFVVIVGGGLAFMLTRDKGDKGAHPAGSQPAKTAEANPKKEEPKPAAAKDPVAEKRKEFTAKVAEVEKAPYAAEPYLALVTFCETEPKLEDMVPKIYERMIAKDPDNATARAALGYKKYDGDDAARKGQWLTAEEFSEVSAADAKKKEAEDKRRNDPFVKASEKIVSEMQAAIDRTNQRGKEIAATAPENPKEGDKVDIDKPKKGDADEAKFKFFYDTKDVPRPYLLAIQEGGALRPEAYAQAFGEILSALHRTFYRRYGQYAKLRDLTGTPVPVWVFATKGQYERWRRCGNGGPPTTFVRAFYSGTAKDNASGYLFLWLRDPHEETNFTEDQIEEIKDTTWHEGTHQLMDFNSPGRGFGIGNTPWMQEGFAEYVGTHSRIPDKNEPDGNRYFFGYPNPERNTAIVAKGLQQKIDESEQLEMKPSLKEIVHCTYPEFWMARAMQESKDAAGEEKQKALELVDGTYCIGWGLCHFLQHAENGKYRDGFNKWLQKELAKESSPQVFEEIFGLDSDEKWKAFDLEFQNYVVFTLRRDAKRTSRKEDAVAKKYETDFEKACAPKKD